jgi:hypothetical protein
MHIGAIIRKSNYASETNKWSLLLKGQTLMLYCLNDGFSVCKMLVTWKGSDICKKIGHKSSKI